MIDGLHFLYLDHPGIYGLRRLVQHLAQVVLGPMKNLIKGLLQTLVTSKKNILCQSSDLAQQFIQSFQVHKTFSRTNILQQQ